MRHAFNTFNTFNYFLSTSASAFPLINPLPFRHFLKSLTRIQPTVIQRVPRRRIFLQRPDLWESGVKNIRLDFRYT